MRWTFLAHAAAVRVLNSSPQVKTTRSAGSSCLWKQTDEKWLGNDPEATETGDFEPFCEFSEAKKVKKL